MSVVKDMLAQYGPEGTFDRARQAARRYAYELKRRGLVSFSHPNKTDIPTIHVVSRTVPQAWEKINMVLLGIGQEAHTHYDPGHKTGSYESFPSMEATVTMHIQDPRAEPRFHKHFLGGWMGFGDYRAEIEGVKDSWVLDPAHVLKLLREGRFQEIQDHRGWLYSYSQRLRAYPFIDIHGEARTIGQLNQVIEKLKADPTAKTAEAITWDPRWDHNDNTMGGKFAEYHAPCLQRLWFRLIPDRKGGFVLNLNAHWRSRDHLKAVPHNIDGVVEGIAEPVRAQLEEGLKVPVRHGRYVDMSDSLHLYGHYFDTRKQGQDAASYLEDAFRIASGNPLVNRLIIPGTPLHEAAMEDIKKEYQFRKANPDYGRNTPSPKA